MFFFGHDSILDRSRAGVVHNGCGDFSTCILGRYNPHPDPTSKFAGRFISINVTLKIFDKLGKLVRSKTGHKHLALSLASIYHPCTKSGNDGTYTCFLDTLDSLLGKVPSESELIIGMDVNANIGTLDDLQSTDFRST